jgi:hypothetical protein
LNLRDLAGTAGAVVFGVGFLRLVWWPTVKQSRKEARELDERAETVRRGIIRMQADLVQARAENAMLVIENDLLRQRLLSSRSD